MPEQPTKKTFAITGIGWIPLLAMVIVALAACGGGQAASPSAAGPVVASASATTKTTTSGAGASGPQTSTDVAAYQGSDRQQMLEAGARQEGGSVSWYTTIGGTGVDAVVAGFQAKYPYLKVNPYRADATTLTTRATQEAQANQNVFDVMESDIVDQQILDDAQLIAPFYTPFAAGLADNLKVDAGNGLIKGLAPRISHIGFAYNTTLIASDAVPKTLNDLMNPGLTGKLSLVDGGTGYNWVGSVLHGMGEDQGRQWLADFARQQKPTIQELSAAALPGLIATGEIPASPTSYYDQILQAQEAQNPVAWVPLDPVAVTVPQLMVGIKGPHPHAALLFIDYEMSDEGQQVLKGQHYFPVTEQVPFGIWVPQQGRTSTQMDQDLQSWTDLFKATFMS